MRSQGGFQIGRFTALLRARPIGNWGQRNYGVEGRLGLEKTFEEHIEKLVKGFREIRRILRDDGVMFLNYGDKYAGGNSGGGSPNCKQRTNKGSLIDPVKVNLPAGNLIGLAWRLALALQADGWILRSDIIWAKAISFNDKYSGSTMPEAVNGWRWERCRVKIAPSKVYREGNKKNGYFPESCENRQAQWSDCPGCAKCEPNGGYVLRKGAWRCTRAHEYVFQFVKQIPYYCDAEAVKEEAHGGELQAGFRGIGSQYTSNKAYDNSCGISAQTAGIKRETTTSRNLRDVWTINPQPYKGAHYATFSEALVEPCIQAGTSQKGCCPACGAPWARIVESKQIKRKRPNDRTDRHQQEGMNSCGNTVAGVETTTIGWRPTCGCEAGDPVPCVVYDPFAGSGTVAAVAVRLGRNYSGSELSSDYLEHQALPRIRAAETGLDIDELDKQRALFK